MDSLQSYMNQFQPRKLNLFLNHAQKFFKRLFDFIKAWKIEFLLDCFGKILKFLTSLFYKLDNALNRFVENIVINKPITKTSCDL